MADRKLEKQPSGGRGMPLSSSPPCNSAGGNFPPKGTGNEASATDLKEARTASTAAVAHAGAGVGDYDSAIKGESDSNVPRVAEQHPQPFTSAAALDADKEGQLLSTAPDAHEGSVQEEVDMMMSRSRH